MAKSRDGRMRVSFGDVAEQINDRVDDPHTAGVDRYVGLEHLDPESLCVTRWGSPDEVSAQKLRFHPGDIIFGKRRAYQRKVAVADFEGICSAHAMVLREREGAIAPGFLVHFMASDTFMERAVQISVGSLSPTINWSTLRDQEFDLPPLPEQTRLVPVLNASTRTLDCFRESTRQAVTLLEALRDEWVASYLAPAVGAPPSNDRVSLAELFTPIVDKGYKGLPILAVTVNGEIVGREELGRHVSDDTGPEKCLRVMPGDIAYNTMRLWQGSVGVASREGLLSPAYTVIRATAAPTSGSVWVDVFRSRPLQREYRKLVRGIAKDRWRIYFADLATVSFARAGVESLDTLARDLYVIRAAIQAQARRASDTSRVLQLIAASAI